MPSTGQASPQSAVRSIAAVTEEIATITKTEEIATITKNSSSSSNFSSSNMAHSNCKNSN